MRADAFFLKTQEFFHLFRNFSKKISNFPRFSKNQVIFQEQNPKIWKKKTLLWRLSASGCLRKNRQKTRSILDSHSLNGHELHWFGHILVVTDTEHKTDTLLDFSCIEYESMSTLSVKIGCNSFLTKCKILPLSFGSYCYKYAGY